MVEPRATPLQSLLDVLSPPRAFQALADALLALGDCLIRLISLLVTLFRLGDRAELSAASYAATATGRNLSKPAFRPTGKAPPSPIVPQADSPPWTTPETTPRFFTEPGFRSSSDDRSSTASLDDGRTSRLSTHSSSYASSRASSSSSSSSSSAASDNTPAGWFTFASSNRPVAPPPSPATASQNRRRARRMAFSIDESRFKLGRVLGSGAYGIVAECTDRETGRKLAIKKIRRIFNNSTDARRCLREVRILGHLEHDNLLHLKYAMLPRGPAGDVDIFSEIYIVSDFMDSDLEKVIKSSATKLEETHIRYIMWQILAGLKYLHSANIMHRDLKPANVLINAESEVKICDFGLARAESFSSTGDQSHATDYVVTRHYRAPEVIVDRTKYDKSVDVWAAACIMGELYNRKVVLPGRDQVHQLSLILALVGKPPEDVIDAINNRNAQRYVRMYKGKDGGVALGEVFPSASPDGLALMERMFLWNPAARVTAGDALGHLFFEEYADMLEWEEEEAPPLKMEFEGKDLSIARIRKLVHREVLRNSPGANTAPPSPSSSAVGFGNAPGSGVDADDVDHDDLKRKSKVDDGSGSDTTGTTGTANSGSPGSRGGAASPKDYDSGAGTSGVDAIEAEAWFSGRSGAAPISRSAPISIAAAVARALASTEDEPPPALVSSFDAEPFNPFTIRRLDGDLKTQKKKDDAGGDRAVGALAALLAADDASKAKAKAKEVDQGKHGLAALLAADDAAKAEASGKTKTAPPAATATTGGGPSPIAPLGRSTSSDSIGDAYATPGSLTPTD